MVATEQLEVKTLSQQRRKQQKPKSFDYMKNEGSRQGEKLAEELLKSLDRELFGKEKAKK